VEGGDPARDRQAQARSARGRAAGVGGEGAEALEGALAVGGRYARTVIGDLQAPAGTVDGGANTHGPALGTVTHGVVEQVDHQLAEPGVVGAHRQPGWDLDVEADGTAGRHQVGHRLVEQVGDVDVGQPQRRHAGVHARELEQVADEAGEPARLPDRGPEVFLVGRYDAVREVLQHGGQAGQWRAQLVGHGRHEGPLLLVHRVELRGHLVEGPGQLTDLVGGLLPDPAAVVTASHPPRGLGHLPQRRGHADGQQLRHAQRQGGRDRDGQQQGDAGLVPHQADQHRDEDADHDEHAELHLDRAHAGQGAAHEDGSSRA
jgi:hypothetical protein